MKIELPFEIGDYIGYIGHYHNSEKEWYELKTAKITRVVIKKGEVIVHAPKCFNPIDAEELTYNTEIMESDDLIIKGEPFVLNQKTKPTAEKWVKNATEHPELVKGLFG